jgi:hypothetical protein
MVPNRRFSSRHGFTPGAAEIQVREDAPDEFRAAILQIALESGLSPSPLRDSICRVLRTLPSRSNWSEYPNIWEEVQGLIEFCEWYQVYDIAEELYQVLARRDDRGDRLDGNASRADYFEQELNRYMVERGIGWQMVSGVFEFRGPEAFELVVRGASSELASALKLTAANEIHEALSDLSRRPTPDLTGAIQHALAALECVARDVTGDPKATLGTIIKYNPSLFPKPLDSAAEKLWGYASETGRHLREGQNPEPEVVTLVVTLSAALATYLSSTRGNKG